jgi:hypothetical protein
VTIAQARELAERYLSQFSSAKTPLALFGDETAEDHDWCYVFPWNTARYVESLNLADSMGPGSGPIVVVRQTGDTWMMGSALPPDEQLAVYAVEHGINR